MTQHIALYGKGGVGKTTLASNLSAALADSGCKVMLIGCDQKSDSGTLLHEYETIPTLNDYLRSNVKPALSDVVVCGYRGIACIELGDPLGEDECASRSIGRALHELRDLRVFEDLNPEYVIYDMPGEVGCAGLAVHFRGAPINHAFVVTAGDLTSFYAANSYFRIMARQDEFLSASILGNGLAGTFEESFLEDFAEQTGARVSGMISRSLVVRHCELYGKTVIEAAPKSNHAQVYRRLARQIIDMRGRKREPLPKPLAVPQLKQWARTWGDRLGELEFGILKDGAGI